MSSTKVSREEIELLRASASSLIEDTAEPCWGLAQRLSQLAERLVIESGERAATFGRGGADALDGPCCPACGWWDDMHAAWCIHAYEDQADEQPEYTCMRPMEDEQAAADAYYELEGMLTWLDLSVLPPVPPAKPPARKPTNWRFDAPDNGQAQEPGGPF